MNTMKNEKAGEKIYEKQIGCNVYRRCNQKHLPSNFHLSANRKILSRKKKKKTL
jgi:hypothetical protein